jgi:hypothetical protein
MSYIILRGLWCHIIVLNVHAPTEDDVKGSIYEILELVFHKFPKYNMKMIVFLSKGSKTRRCPITTAFQL